MDDGFVFQNRLRLWQGLAGKELDEVQHVAMLAAPEALELLPLRIHSERRRFLRVERA